MTTAPIEQALADLRAGKMIVVVDDETRENEGDLICAAEMVTPAIINFMAQHGRGWICLALTSEDCDRLELPQMVEQDTEAMSTAFTAKYRCLLFVSRSTNPMSRMPSGLMALVWMVNDCVRN